MGLTNGPRASLAADLRQCAASEAGRSARSNRGTARATVRGSIDAQTYFSGECTTGVVSRSGDSESVASFYSLASDSVIQIRAAAR